MDAIRVKVRDNGHVTNKAVYIYRHHHGRYQRGFRYVGCENEGAKFWLQVVTVLRNRGVQDIFIA